MKIEKEALLALERRPNESKKNYGPYQSLIRNDTGYYGEDSSGQLHPISEEQFMSMVTSGPKMSGAERMQQLENHMLAMTWFEKNKELLKTEYETSTQSGAALVQPGQARA